MPQTAQSPKKKSQRRPAARQFMARQSGEVKTLLERVLDGFKIVVAPNMSYARIQTTDGLTLGYAIPSGRHVRLDIPARVDAAPAAVRKGVEHGGHGRRKFDVRDNAHVGQARDLLKFIADNPS